MKLISIQYLRAFAALTVIIFHAKLQVERFNYDMDWFFYPYMHFGIDIFFVMSGFLMWITTRKPITPTEFFVGRIVRVAPLYWLATTLIVVLVLAAPSTLQSTQFSFDLVVASYLFIPWENAAQHGILPIYVVGWTLNLEMFFYLIYAQALNFPLRKRVLVALASFAALTLLGFLPSSGIAALDSYTTFRAAEFGVGIGLGYLYSERRITVSQINCFAMIAGGVLLVPLAELAISWQVLHDYMLLTGATLLITGMILHERQYGVRNIGWLVLVGDATYSIYLIHPIVLSALGQMVKRLAVFGIPGFPLVFTAVGIASSIGVGLVVFFWVERPLAAWMVRSFTPIRRPAVAAE